MASVATDIIPLPSALERALATFPEDVATPATTALRACLYDRLTTPDAREWSSSTLTGSGFPAELTFTTADDRLRYTVEPGTSHDTPQQRLDIAVRLLAVLAGADLSEEASQTWRQTQHDAELRFGAWLGGRHGAGDRTRFQTNDEFKLYIETQGISESGHAAVVGPAPRLPDRTPSLRMVAFTPKTQRYEAYYRISSLEPCHLPRVLAPAGLESHSRDLLSYLAGAYGHVMRERLPGSSVGVSYSMQAGGQPQSVSLFFFARVFWGADARIREQFGALARAIGWDDRRYQQITSALASRQSWTTHHGIFGVTLTRDGTLHLSIGVRPPDLTDTETGT